MRESFLPFFRDIEPIIVRMIKHPAIPNLVETFICILFGFCFRYVSKFPTRSRYTRCEKKMDPSVAYINRLNPLELADFENVAFERARQVRGVEVLKWCRLIHQIRRRRAAIEREFAQDTPSPPTSSME